MLVTLRVTGYMNRGHPVTCNPQSYLQLSSGSVSRLACLRTARKAAPALLRPSDRRTVEADPHTGPPPSAPRRG